MLLPNDFLLSATFSLTASIAFRVYFSRLVHAKKTGLRIMLSGTDSFRQLRRDPEQARIFGNAMTTMSKPVASAQFCIVEALPA
jgi:hypothetical protein